MNVLLVVSIFLGVFMIVLRGPFAFAPQAMARFYREQLFDKPNRFRTMGVFFGILGFMMVIPASDVAGIGARIVLVLGIILILAALLIISAPGPVKRFVVGVLDFFGPMGLRVIGVVNIIVGIVWIYLSFRFFG